MSKPRLIAPMICLSALLLAGCGNKEKAEMAIGLDAATRHPELVRAMERVDLAGVIAMLDLNPATAAQLCEWSGTHGQEVRGQIDRQLGELAAMVPQLRAAGDDLVAKRASTEADQEALLLGRLGERVEVLTQESQPLDVEELVEPHAESLALLAAKLTDRQQLVVLGHWQSALEAAGELAELGAQPAEDDLNAKREALTTAIVQGRGHGLLPDEEVTAEVRKLVDAVPLGLQPAALEGQVKRLYAAVPAVDAEQQAEETTATLATLLCQGPAPELLALVK